MNWCYASPLELVETTRATFDNLEIIYDFRIPDLNGDIQVTSRPRKQRFVPLTPSPRQCAFSSKSKELEKLKDSRSSFDPGNTRNQHEVSSWASIHPLKISNECDTYFESNIERKKNKCNRYEKTTDSPPVDRRCCE